MSVINAFLPPLSCTQLLTQFNSYHANHTVLIQRKFFYCFAQRSQNTQDRWRAQKFSGEQLSGCLIRHILYLSYISLYLFRTRCILSIFHFWSFQFHSNRVRKPWTPSMLITAIVSCVPGHSILKTWLLKLREIVVELQVVHLQNFVTQPFPCTVRCIPSRCTSIYLFCLTLWPNVIIQRSFLVQCPGHGKMERRCFLHGGKASKMSMGLGRKGPRQVPSPHSIPCILPLLSDSIVHDDSDSFLLSRISPMFLLGTSNQVFVKEE